MDFQCGCSKNITIKSEAHFNLTLKTLIVHPCFRKRGAVTDLCTGDATGIPTLSRIEQRVSKSANSIFLFHDKEQPTKTDQKT